MAEQFENWVPLHRHAGEREIAFQKGAAAYRLGQQLVPHLLDRTCKVTITSDIVPGELGNLRYRLRATVEKIDPNGTQAI